LRLGVAIILYLLFYFPKELANELSLRQKLKKIDYGGAFLVTAGLVMFILGIEMGGNTYPWKSGTVLGLIVTGALVLIGFVLYGRCQSYSCRKVWLVSRIVDWSKKSTCPRQSLSCPKAPSKTYEDTPWYSSARASVVSLMSVCPSSGQHVSL
jgi:hypothetical protein